MSAQLLDEIVSLQSSDDRKARLASFFKKPRQDTFRTFNSLSDTVILEKLVLWQQTWEKISNVPFERSLPYANIGYLMVSPLEMSHAASSIQAYVERNYQHERILHGIEFTQDAWFGPISSELQVVYEKYSPQFEALNSQQKKILQNPLTIEESLRYTPQKTNLSKAGNISFERYCAEFVMRDRVLLLINGIEYGNNNYRLATKKGTGKVRLDDVCTIIFDKIPGFFEGIPFQRVLKHIKPYMVGKWTNYKSKRLDLAIEYEKKVQLLSQTNISIKDYTVKKYTSKKLEEYLDSWVTAFQEKIPEISRDDALRFLNTTDLLDMNVDVKTPSSMYQLLKKQGISLTILSQVKHGYLYKRLKLIDSAKTLSSSLLFQPLPNNEYKRTVRAIHANEEKKILLEIIGMTDSKKDSYEKSIPYWKLEREINSFVETVRERTGCRDSMRIAKLYSLGEKDAAKKILIDIVEEVVSLSHFKAGNLSSPLNLEKFNFTHALLNISHHDRQVCYFLAAYQSKHPEGMSEKMLTSIIETAGEKFWKDYSPIQAPLVRYEFNQTVYCKMLDRYLKSD